MMLSRRIKSKKGMTIMELLIAVVIVGIVAAMAVPRFQIAYERIKFRAATREITSKIRLARSFAVSTKAQHGVYFDQTSLSYILFKDLVNTGAMQYDVGDSIISLDTLPGVFSFLGTDNINNSIVFRSNGSTSGTVNVTTLASTPDIIAVHQHTVLAATGRIETTSAYY